MGGFLMGRWFRPKTIISLLVILLLFRVPAEGGEQLLQQFGKEVLERWQQKDKARISLGYELHSEQWLTFVLPPLTDEVKIITNADMPQESVLPPEEKAAYAIEFELLNAKNEVIKTGRYHHYTRVTRYIDPQSGEEVTAAYYFGKNRRPADGRLIRIDLQGLPDAGESVRIRFRLKTHDPRIEQALLRLYVPERISERKRRYAWQRMSQDKKEYLSRYNVYPPDFMSDDEKHNLLRNIWQPLAPEGTEGRDYILRKLYILKDVENSPLESRELQTELRADRHSRITLPIPEDGATLEFNFFDRAEQGIPRNTAIELIWFGKKQLKTHNRLPLSDETMVYRKHFEGGLIEIRASRPVAVTIYLMEDQEKIDITPEPMRVRTFVTNARQSLVYPIAHSGTRPTPFRVACRRRLTDMTPSVATLEYTLLDRHQKVMKKGRLSWNSMPSFYDMSLHDSQFPYVSDPAVFYFELSPQTAFIRFSAEEEVLLTGYSRPPHMPKTIRVPEDDYRASRQSDEKQMTWFPFMPLEYRRILQQQQSVIVGVWFRPPDEKPEIAAGRFLWESFRPTGRAAGHYLLTPWQKKTYERDAARQSVYRRLPLDRPVSVELDSGRLLNIMRPELFFYRSSSFSPFELRIDVDGQRYVTRQLTGLTGRIELPPLTVAPHTLNITSDAAVRVFMNALRSNADGYLLRFAHRLTPRGLRFAYTKQAVGDETLSLLVAFQAQGTQRFDVTVELSDDSAASEGPFEHLSLLKRRYSLRPDRNGPVYLLHTSVPALSSRQTCFFPLHADISPGTYQLTIRSKAGQTGYLQLYRVTAGRHPEYKVSRETRFIERQCN
jgi:hypothetical protein